MEVRRTQRVELVKKTSSVGEHCRSVHARSIKSFAGRKALKSKEKTS